jgi:hypothetical protein
MMTRALARRQKTDARARAPRASRREIVVTHGRLGGHSDIRTLDRPRAPFFRPLARFFAGDGMGGYALAHIYV